VQLLVVAAKQKQSESAAVVLPQLPAAHQEQPESAEAWGTGARVVRAQTAAKQP